MLGIVGTPLKVATTSPARSSSSGEAGFLGRGTSPSWWYQK
jgi:hypothetical protein